jgi:hypothetical protein
MAEEGVGVDALLHHCVFSTEYIYKTVFKEGGTEEEEEEEGGEGGGKRKVITVYDLAGANLGDLKGDAKVFLKRGLGLIQQHYPVCNPSLPPSLPVVSTAYFAHFLTFPPSFLPPSHPQERSRVIIIANAPVWFSILWRLLKSILNEATQKKIRIAAAGTHALPPSSLPSLPFTTFATPPLTLPLPPSVPPSLPPGKETRQALLEFIDEAHIPVEYGGTLRCSPPEGEEGREGGKDGCRWFSPQEVAMREFVEKLNASHLPGTGFPPVAPMEEGGRDGGREGRRGSMEAGVTSQ